MKTKELNVKSDKYTTKDGKVFSGDNAYDEYCDYVRRLNKEKVEKDYEEKLKPQKYELPESMLLDVYGKNPTISLITVYDENDYGITLCDYIMTRGKDVWDDLDEMKPKNYPSLFMIIEDMDWIIILDEEHIENENQYLLNLSEFLTNCVNRFKQPIMNINNLIKNIGQQYVAENASDIYKVLDNVISFLTLQDEDEYRDFIGYIKKYLTDTNKGYSKEELKIVLKQCEIKLMALKNFCN